MSWNLLKRICVIFFMGMLVVMLFLFSGFDKKKKKEPCACNVKFKNQVQKLLQGDLQPALPLTTTTVTLHKFIIVLLLLDRVTGCNKTCSMADISEKWLTP